MKLARLLTIVALITLSALAYVYQQTRVYALAYLSQRKLAELQDSLDKNSLLRYAVSEKVSLVHISAKLCTDNDTFSMPEAYRLVKVSSSSGILQPQKRRPSTNIFARIFGVQKQAEAKTINR